MVYNSGGTGIDDVRVETGNLLATDYPDATITKKINSAYSMIQLAAGRASDDPFISTDVEYDFARELEIKIAARDSLKPYSADDNIRAKVQELDAEVQRDITFLKENLQEAGGAEEADIMVSASSYVSYGAAMDEDPEQTTVTPYRSLLTDSV
jgi:hypothetical protein